MEQRAEISNVRAEMLLNYLYPELAESWRVENRGTFYRNYSEDILAYDPEEVRVDLSRDGLLRLLPPRMVSSSFLDSGKDIVSQSQREAQELRVLTELFTPLDSILFRLNMRAEVQASELFNGYEEYVLREYFGYDISTEENRYVLTMLPMLLYVAKLKVDYGTLSTILELIVGYKVSFEIKNYSQSDRVGVALLRVLFTIDVEGLSGEEYRVMNGELSPLFELIREWFVPFDHVCEFRVRDQGKVGDTLSYNMRLKEKVGKIISKI